MPPITEIRQPNPTNYLAVDRLPHQNRSLQTTPETTQSHEKMGNRRIVVTGVGVVSPLGLDANETWSNLIAGRTGISEIDIPFSTIKAGGEVKGKVLSAGEEVTLEKFEGKRDLQGVVLPKDLRRLSPSVQYSVRASAEALKDAGLLKDSKLTDDVDATRVGARIATGIGGATEIPGISEKIKKGERLPAFSTLLMEPERVSSVPSMKLGLKGPLGTPLAACAGGNLAITDAYKDIKMGDADIMLAGGTEAALVPVALEGFKAAQALSEETDPKKIPFASKPFDTARNGFVMGEGAAVLVLEELNHALARGATIYAELVGYGNTADAGGDTDSTGEGQVRAMKAALRSSMDDIKAPIYIQAHGTSTPAGDKTEMESIQTIVNTTGIDKKNLKVSSTKGATGHLVGGAGAIEAVFSVLAIKHGIIPPTINHTETLTAGEGIDVVPNDAIAFKPKRVLNNSFGFGGFNTSTAFQGYEE